MNNVEHKVFFPLTFQDVLEHVREYVYLSQMVFEECYDLVYVLDLDFVILPFVATCLSIWGPRRFEGPVSMTNIIIDLILSALVHLV